MSRSFRSMVQGAFEAWINANEDGDGIPQFVLDVRSKFPKEVLLYSNSMVDAQIQRIVAEMARSETTGPVPEKQMDLFQHFAMPKEFRLPRAIKYKNEDGGYGLVSAERATIAHHKAALAIKAKNAADAQAKYLAYNKFVERMEAEAASTSDTLTDIHDRVAQKMKAAAE